MEPLSEASLEMIIKALLETVVETGNMAPEGPIFMAFQTHGMTHEQYERLVGKMVELKLVERKDHCLSVTKTGQTVLSRIG